jgi:hypothetical protein
VTTDQSTDHIAAILAAAVPKALHIDRLKDEGGNVVELRAATRTGWWRRITLDGEKVAVDPLWYGPKAVPGEATRPQILQHRIERDLAQAQRDELIPDAQRIAVLHYYDRERAEHTFSIRVKTHHSPYINEAGKRRLSPAAIQLRQRVIEIADAYGWENRHPDAPVRRYRSRVLIHA